VTILFLAFAALLIACSLMVILHRNPVTSALFLVLAFCSLAGLYLLLRAEFLAMVQIIVYAGAIMVLFLFVIMYLNLRRDVEDGVPFVLRRVVGWGVGGLLLVQGALLVAKRWATGPPSEAPLTTVGNTAAVAQILYTRYLFPFEITSILLLVAMVGAVVIGRGGMTRGPAPPPDRPVPGGGRP
jgi:NADH-quinone oxidoreductase subunit J